MAATKNDGISRVERAAMAIALKEKGCTRAEISEKLGISVNYCSSLFIDPDGSKERARKDRYRGVCVDCGGPTTYGKVKRCLACQKALTHKQRKWSQQRILDDIHAWAAIHGRPPKSNEWLYYKSPPDEDDRRWPQVSCVMREFGSWANAIEAAGFPRPKTGVYERKPSRPARHELFVDGKVPSFADRAEGVGLLDVVAALPERR